MGAHHNDGRGNQKTGGSRRGSVKNAARLEAFAGRAGRGNAEWTSCDPERLQAVVGKITAMGGAVTIGLSRDQGAHFLTLLLDDEKQTLWFNGDADLNTELDAVDAILDNMTD